MGLREARRSRVRFQLIGGHIAIDLANMLDHRPSGRPKELLPTYADLAAWSEETGVLSRAVTRRLLRQAARRPAAARRALGAARAVREALHALFSAAARGEAIPAGPLAALNARLGPALARARVVRGRRGPEWGWERDDTLDAMLPPVLRAAGELLVGARPGAIRECASERCRWLFLDESPTARRRWCSMAICGNRAKVRRHYSRRRTTGANNASAERRHESSRVRS